MTRWPLAAAVLACVLLSGCAGNDRPPPSPLVPIEPQLAARTAWTLDIGAVRFPLAVAVTPGVFTVASSDGAVVAVQADTGRELWRGQVDGANDALDSGARFLRQISLFCVPNPTHSFASAASPIKLVKKRQKNVGD